MLYPETYKQATRLAASTTELIERQKGVLQPMNYTIWYNYAANHHPDMKSEIDALLEKEGSINQAQYEEIFSRYFGIDETGIEILATSRSAAETVGRVQAEQRDATEHTKNYGENLEGITADLVEGMGAEELRATAQRVLRETITVAKKTEALQRELTSATTEIGAPNHAIAPTVVSVERRTTSRGTTTPDQRRKS